MDTDVLIIGGGISGLATAWWLAQSGVHVEVWEKATRPGGKIKSYHQDGYLTEQAASMIMNFRSDVDVLIKSAGLDQEKESRLLDSESKRYLLHEGRLAAMPMTIGGMFMTSLWSSKAKLNLLTEAFKPRRFDENETVTQFITRRFGNEFLEKAMDPFVAGTLASDPDLANAMEVLPRLTTLEKHYGSITAGVIINKLLRRRTARSTETFSFKGGISTLINKILCSPNIHFKGGVDVNNIEKNKHGWSVCGNMLGDELKKTCRQIVLGTPADVTARLLKNTSSEISQLLNGIEYAPLSVVHLGFDKQQVKHKLDSAGFLVPGREKRNITGNLWMSSLFSNRAPEGKTLLSSYVGGARQPHLTRLDDTKTTDCVLADLESILGIKTPPEMVRIDRHAQALPLYHGNYSQRMQALHKALQPHSGLNIVANYKGGVSVRDRIACAQTQAREILINMSKTDKIDLVSDFNPCVTSSMKIA